MLDQSWTLSALFSLGAFISRRTFVGLIKLKLRLLGLMTVVMNFVLFRMSTSASIG